MNKNLRLKRNETFSIREGWLEKGINIIIDNPKCFSKDAGPLSFGLGSNMCKSLRYWLEACTIATFSQNGASLTDFGKFLLAYDQYLEKNVSWWLIHLYLSTNVIDAPVINAYFNMDAKKVDKDYIFRNIKDRFTREYSDTINDNSLDSDISVLLKSYYASKITNPEDNMNCPLARLGLMEIDDNHNYIKTSPNYSSLDFRAVYFSILNCLELNTVHNQTFNIEDLIHMQNNPCYVFNLSKAALFVYLDEMKKAGLVTVVKTAGLNTVTIEKVADWSDLFKEEE